MLPHLSALILGSVALVAGQGIPDPQLTGTWSSKSNKTMTGPGFYDPVNERMFEPSHTGISYSFTDDGHYEVAYYRAVANPTRPQCPSAIMQWQHGTFRKEANGSLILTPIAVDGRQLLSDPCRYDSAVFTRYNQTELISKYEVLTDPYHKILRLNLYQFDGAPMMPLYIAMKPPQMLPTQTLNPTTSATAAGAAATSTGRSKLFRRAAKADDGMLPLNHRILEKRKARLDSYLLDLDKWWWFGWGMTGVGGLLYLFF